MIALMMPRFYPAFCLRAALWILSVFIASPPACAQQYLLANEQIIVSFLAGGNHKIVLAKDTSDSYLVFRFGTVDSIFIEYPGLSADSRGRFRYSYYLRGGGTANEGLDLNTLCFTDGASLYALYCHYSAADDQPHCGLKITGSINGITRDFTGIAGSVTGNLSVLRNSSLPETGKEPCD